MNELRDDFTDFIIGMDVMRSFTPLESPLGELCRTHTRSSERDERLSKKIRESELDSI